MLITLIVQLICTLICLPLKNNSESHKEYYEIVQTQAIIASYCVALPSKCMKECRKRVVQVAMVTFHVIFSLCSSSVKYALHKFRLIIFTCRQSNIIIFQMELLSYVSSYFHETQFETLYETYHIAGKRSLDM